MLDKPAANTISPYIASILKGAILALLFAQISYMVSAIYRNQDSQGVIYATDLDAGNEIKHGMKTGFFSGGSYDHGVLYFKIARLLGNFSPVSDHHGSGQEQFEKRIHFALQITSLISICLISVLLSYLLIDETLYRLLAVLLINAAFFNEYIWTAFILRAHPDILLAFLSALFLFFIYKAWTAASRRNFFIAGLVGGAALSTKLIFLLFLPGLVFLEIPPISKKGVLKLVKLYSLIAFSYLILAFPKSIKTKKNIAFLKFQSQYSVSPTWGSFIEWWRLLLGQGWQPLLIVALLFAVFGRYDSSANYAQKDRYLSYRIWAAAFIPFIFILARKIVSPIEHYTIPFAAVLLTAAAIWFSTFDMGRIKKINGLFAKDGIKYTAVILFLIFTEMMVGIVPKNVDEVLKHVMGGRLEAKSAYGIINSYLNNGKRVLVDYYVPANRSNKNVTLSYMSMTLSEFREKCPDIIAFNRKDISRIMEGERPADDVIVDHRNYEEIREFYGIFYKKEAAIDPFNNKWIRIYENPSSVEIWERQIQTGKKNSL